MRAAVRLAAIPLVAQAMGCAVIWGDDWYMKPFGADPASREAAVRGVTDQEKLVRIVTEDNSWACRRIALDKLDQPHLQVVAGASGPGLASTRAYAVSRLEDQALVERYARTDASWRVRRAALGRLTDERLVVRIILEPSDAEAERDEPGNLAYDSVAWLTDQPLLARVARESPERPFVDMVSPHSGMGGMVDAFLLGENASVILPGGKVMKGGYRREVRQGFQANFRAVEKLTDSALLEALAADAPSSYVRKAAAERLAALRPKDPAVVVPPQPSPDATVVVERDPPRGRQETPLSEPALTVAPGAASPAAGPALAFGSASLAENQVAVRYHRPRGDYEGWGLHAWNEDRSLPGITWERAMPPTGRDDFGVYWVLDLRHFPDGRVRYIIHRGDRKEQCGKDMSWHVRRGREAWINADDCAIYHSRDEATGARR